MWKWCFCGAWLLLGISAAGAERGEVVIGLLLTLSGPFADFGEDCRRGVLMAESAQLRADGTAPRVRFARDRSAKRSHGGSLSSMPPPRESRTSGEQSTRLRGVVDRP